jgi:hypothetical protein
MYLVKAVMQGIGETLFLRYNLLGDALVTFGKLQKRQLWHEASDDEKPVTEEFKDDFGVTALVPAHGILFTQMLDLERFMAGDARQNVRGQQIMQKEVERATSQMPIISPAPNGPRFSQ